MILYAHVFVCPTVLEVMQFARDAHVAEGWMIAQEPYLKNENLGVSRSDRFFFPVINTIVEYPKYVCFPPFLTLEDIHTYFIMFTLVLICCVLLLSLIRIVVNPYFLIFFLFAQTDLNEVEQLLEKHSNFEKLVNTQEERFLALERLTTVK